jgi:uroporphyrinogen decarboxylase
LDQIDKPKLGKGAYMTTGPNDIPYLLRAVRKEALDRPPVWMMRQAGRYMKVYRDLREKYPSFRERSENPDLSIEISLQPWKAFTPDGVIMFSDILTPLPRHSL